MIVAVRCCIPIVMFFYVRSTAPVLEVVDELDVGAILTASHRRSRQSTTTDCYSITICSDKA